MSKHSDAIDFNQDFVKHQFEFCAHIRDPQQNPMPAGIEDRRMGIYRDLLFNNVANLLAGTYPVLKNVLGENAWLALVRDYFAQHRARTPLFPQMPNEFLQYLQTERGEQARDPAFLYELAHYEWVELALSIDTRHLPAPQNLPAEQLLQETPKLSPLAWPLAYHFPVAQISPEFMPEQASEQMYYVLVYRDRQDRVHFFELNPVTARLLELLTNNEQQLSGQACLEQIAQELQHPNPSVVIQGGLGILQDLQQRDVIIGAELSS